MQKFLNDPIIIENIMNTHFQQIGISYMLPSKYKTSELLSYSSWNYIYKEKTNIPIEAINQLSTPITYEESISTIKDLSNNKTSSLSGITYKIIKTIPSPFHYNLVKFYNFLLLKA
jgi:hypothetical protein